MVPNHLSRMLAVLAGIVLTAGVASGNTDDSAPETTATGRVIAMTTVETPGSDQPSLVVLLRTDSGDQTMVDLGPATQAEELELDLGDRLTARGAAEKVHGMTYVLAEEASTSDGQVAIDRSQQPAVRDTHERERPDKDAAEGV